MTTHKPPKPCGLPDLALGSWEAACICGVHYTRIKRMAHAGQLIHRPMGTAWAADPDAPKGEFAVYSLDDCDQNWIDYQTMLLENGGRSRHRPRSDEWLSKRDGMLARLTKVEPILYADAISTAQASAILGVHVTWVNLLVREGKLRARQAISDRRNGGKVYIVSRRSCDEHRAAVLLAEYTGKKPGLTRLPSADKPAPARSRRRRK